MGWDSHSLSPLCYDSPTCPTHVGGGVGGGKPQKKPVSQAHSSCSLAKNWTRALQAECGLMGITCKVSSTKYTIIPENVFRHLRWHAMRQALKPAIARRSSQRAPNSNLRKPSVATERPRSLPNKPTESLSGQTVKRGCKADACKHVLVYLAIYLKKSCCTL